MLMLSPVPSPELDPPALLGLAANWELAMHRGDFEAAWRETDRLELPRQAAVARGEAFELQPHHLTWDGRPLENCRVLIRCQHGLGDSIQFLRYARLLQQRGCQVIVRAQPALLPLLRHHPNLDLLENAWTTEPEPAHDVAIECMELAYAFRHTASDVPSRVPYIDLRELPHFPLPERGRLNVGLIWAASDWNPLRSLPVHLLAPLACLPGVQLFSLQQGPHQADLHHLPFSVLPLSHHTTDILDAGRAMLALDCVVTVDGMCAHLAGALARPTYVLLTHDCDWRWHRDCRAMLSPTPGVAISPWYPTLRLLRQPPPGCWVPALERLAAELRSLQA